MLLPFLVLLPMAFLLPPGAQAGEIIGGQVAKPHSRPYMAYLERKVGPRVEKCGGFLVREDFVLTAAHCADGNITVILGAHNVHKKEKTQQRIPVWRKIPHCRYNKTSHENDLMLLQLEELAELNEVVKTIQLPRQDHMVKPGCECSVAGWGKTSPYSTIGHDTATNVLREVELKVMSDATCQKEWPIQCYYNPLAMMCVGDPEEEKASYSGDSGGPLVCDGTAQGIVSFGRKNGTPPRVFTRVSTYISWIKGEMGHLRSRRLHSERPRPLP